MKKYYLILCIIIVLVVICGCTQSAPPIQPTDYHNRAYSGFCVSDCDYTSSTSIDKFCVGKYRQDKKFRV